MTKTHALAAKLEALIESFSLQPHIIVVNPDCIQISYTAFAGAGVNWLTAAIGNAGWHVSIDRSSGPNILYMIEPMKQAPQPPSPVLFHATLKSNLDSIRAAGIKPARKAGTWTGRSYPTPRAFFAVSQWNAFVHIATHNQGSPVPHGLTPLTNVILDQWELLALTDPAPFQFYSDPIMVPALWTGDMIPPRALQTVDGWREDYRRAATWDQPSLTAL